MRIRHPFGSKGIIVKFAPMGTVPRHRTASRAGLALRGPDTVRGPTRAASHRRTPLHRTRRAAQPLAPDAARSTAPWLPVPMTRCQASRACGSQRGPVHTPSHAAPGAWYHHDRPTPHGAWPEAGLGPAGVAALSEGTQSVCPGAVVPGRLLLCAMPDNKAARSNPTLAVSRRAMY